MFLLFLNLSGRLKTKRLHACADGLKVLDWATVRGYREGENPARWKGRLDKLLPAPGKIQKTVHRKALTIDAVQQFMRDLRDKEGVAARALEFVVLTAARSGEVRGVTWSEIDLDAAVWVVPGDRMKAGREHRVPLCAQAVELLKKCHDLSVMSMFFHRHVARCCLIWHSWLSCGVWRWMRSHMVFAQPLETGLESVQTIQESLLNKLLHTLESKVEAAYRRGDALEKRRTMMQEWSDFLYATK
jgi:integrase